MVEEGQDIRAAAPQSATELAQFLQTGGHTTPQGVDEGGHHRLAAAAVGLAVGGDDALVDAPRHDDRHVVVVGEYAGQPGSLTGAEQG